MYQLEEGENVKKPYRYMRHMDNIQIGIDSTDHVVFICDECKRPCEVRHVYSETGLYNGANNPKEVCTWIILECNSCRRIGQRKFYWNEDGKFCIHRTYKVRE